MSKLWPRYPKTFLKEDQDKTKFNSVIFIINPKICMDIIQAYVKVFNKPLNLTYGSITGVCSEVTAYVISREEINFSFLCSGARIFAGFDDCDLLCGIPHNMTKKLIRETLNINKERQLDYQLLKGYREIDND